MDPPETRAEHDRDDLRYPSDLTDAEWQILAPLLPPPAETGRHRCWPMREVMNAIFFVLRGGCPWRMLWLSMMAALGLASRPTRWRSSITK